jgi:hypothetical protein
MKIVNLFLELFGALLYVLILLRLLYPFLKNWVTKNFQQHSENEQWQSIAASLLAIAYLLQTTLSPIMTASKLDPNNGIFKYGAFFSLAALVWAFLLHVLALLVIRVFGIKKGEQGFTIFWAVLLLIMSICTATTFKALLETMLPYPSIPGIH